ncbi:hypothetical protein LVJ94_45800 [Pendulispora rubella]|uniref:Uncharacterized protein n=1 Tax=Pendulispora rubella TaxID=2741070 RepID=A0ABZ2KZV6_9BACT
MTRTWVLAVGGLAALGGLTFFFWKIGSPPAPPARAAVAETDAGADACTALRDANEAMLEKLQQAKKDCHIVRPDLGCVTTRTGVMWGYRIARTRTKPAEGNDVQEIQECATEHDVELVRRDAAGTKVLAGGKETLSYDGSTKQNELSLEALADYDGDGEVEILRVHDAFVQEGAPEHTVTVLTFKDGDAKPYPPAAALKKIEAQRDVDGDGRPDLLSRGPYAGVAVTDALGNERPLGSAMFAYHALANGAFELGDAASVAYTRSRCPSPPKDVAITLDDTTGATEHDAFADSLVCARLWGVTQEKIEHAWASVCRDFDAAENPFACQTWPTALAAATPPFVLR